MTSSEYKQRKDGILLDKSITPAKRAASLHNLWVKYIHDTVNLKRYGYIKNEETPVYRVNRNDPNFDRPYNSIAKTY